MPTASYPLRASALALPAFLPACHQPQTTESAPVPVRVLAVRDAGSLIWEAYGAAPQGAE